MIEAFGAASGLAQIMRETARRKLPDRYWWLPLSLLARHGVSRSSIADHAGSEPAQALFTELLASCGEWTGAQAVAKPAPAQELQAMRHLVVMGQLHADTLLRVRANEPHRFAAELYRVGLPQLYQAWKAARRFSRP